MTLQLKTKNHLLLLFALLFTILFSSNSNAETLHSFESQGITQNVCNASTFTQIPGTNFFLSRKATDPDARGCPKRGTSFALALFEMQENTEFSFSIRTMEFKYYVSVGRYTIGDGIKVWGSYDPYPFFVRGQLYVAYECANSNPGETVGVCIGPLNLQGGKYLLSNQDTYLTVRGSRKTKGAAPADLLSASVPKVLHINNRVFLYWTAVDYADDGSNDFDNLITRGTELRWDPSTNRIKPAGLHYPIFSDEGRIVMTHSSTKPLAAGGKSGTTYDIFDFGVTPSNEIYAFSATGKNGCTKPFDHNNGCYKLTITKTKKPISFNTFGKNYINTNMSVNRMEYSRFFTEGSTSNIILKDLRSEHDKGVVMFKLNKVFKPKPTYGNIASFNNWPLRNIMTRIELYYIYFLDRVPSYQERNNAYNNFYLAKGKSKRELALSFLNSREYKNRWNEMEADDKIRSLYWGLLLREPSSQEVRNYRQHVGNKTRITNAFLGSREFQRIPH